MKALSIRQPWAWLIINGGKDIENRSWPTRLRGRILVHASKGMTRDEYRSVDDLLTVSSMRTLGIKLPAFEELERGGIVGSVEIAGLVSESKSPWFFGPYGFVLQNPRPMPFIQFKGALGFFDIPGMQP